MKKTKELIEKTKSIQFEYKKKQKINADEFNIFSILRKDNDEVNLHSKFIYELLNINGSHSQGSDFLNLFIFYALDIYVDDEDIYVASREVIIQNNRRIDFVIESKEYLIAIEMKIDASDQPKQLYDYYQELKRIAKKGQKIRLYYLTKYGDSPSSDSCYRLKEDKDKGYIRLSFEDDILFWIDGCLDKVKNVRKLYESISQYKRLIEKITGHLSDEIGEEMKSLVKSEQDIEAINTLVLAYKNIWFDRELSFWEKLGEKIQNLKIYKEGEYIIVYAEKEKNEEITLKTIKDMRTKRSVEKCYFGCEIVRIIDNFLITIEIEQFNNLDFEMNIIFSFNRINAKNIMNEDLYQIFKKIGFKIDDKKLNYIFPLEIKFYGKRVSQPSYSLFNDNIFNKNIDLVRAMIKKTLIIINENKKEILLNLK